MMKREENRHNKIAVVEEQKESLHVSIVTGCVCRC